MMKTEPIPPIASPVTASVPSTGIGRKTVLIVLGIGIVVIGTLFYVLYEKKKAQEVLERDRYALEVSQFGPGVFQPGGYKDYIAGVDGQLAASALTKETELMLLFRKGIALIDAVETDEKARDVLRVEAGTLFRALYEGHGSDSDFDMRARSYAVLGFMLDFNQRFFLNGNTRLLPLAYSGSYMELYNASSTRTVTWDEYQKLAFATFVKLAHDPSTKAVEDNRTFISNRMYTTATYLDSFYRELSQEERDTLLAQLKSDLDLYPNTVGSIFTDVRHNRLVADFYRAYASHVYAKRSPQAPDLALRKKEARDYYELARKNVDLLGDFKETNATMGQYIDAFYLSFLIASKPEGYKEKISEVVTEMKGYAQDPYVKVVVGRFYNDFLSTRGSWMGIKSSLVSLSSSNKAYAAYLSSLGVTLK